MTDKIEKLLKQLRDGEYKNLRTSPSVNLHLGTENFKKVLAAEKLILLDNDDFGFNRSMGRSCISTAGIGNVTPNYYRVISRGFDSIKKEICASIAKTSDSDKIRYGKTMTEYIDLCIEFSDRYKELAKENGNIKLYDALQKIPRNGAETFYEACIFIKMCIYFLRIHPIDHVGLGRFDQYMYPFYLRDKENGVTDEEILEVIEAFFISINIDTDLYSGVQQGDNGQSMVLGGFDQDGKSMYNELSQMCMQASLELNIIDPKINLRVGKNTPDEIYEYATLLTKQGLGFPQYCNDDIAVPGLVKLGYDYDDAINYTVAACWECIIPNCGADIPNIATMDFPSAVNRVIVSKLTECETFSELIGNVMEEIKNECDTIVHTTKSTANAETPLLSVFFDGCTENLTDMWYGGTKYTNFGCHGAGIANAADALAAVKKNIFNEQTISKETLLDALANNFEGYTEIRNLLRNSPKMGNNDDYVDNIACEIMQCFSKNLNNRDNQNGGIWRAGTGSAMEYIYKGEKCPTTADGRKAGEPYSSSFSPSLDAKTKGVLSIIQSFTKYNLSDIINGGPLTIEIHDTVLRNSTGINKVAQLVKNFILLGGHQLQINSINRDRLLDAQKHPENYPNLIVRVWGWSGYFNELDLKYQNHIIRRTEYMN